MELRGWDIDERGRDMNERGGGIEGKKVRYGGEECYSVLCMRREVWIRGV